MKVPLPKQSFAYYILTNNKILPHPISTYFGNGSRIKTIRFIPTNVSNSIYGPNPSPYIKFNWFHGVKDLDKYYSTKFITNINFNNLDLDREYKFTEEIVYTMLKYNLYKNPTFIDSHNIDYKYIFEDEIASTNLLSYNKKNITSFQIENDLLSYDKIFNMEQSVKNIMINVILDI
jgi:hypothetical protein